MAHGTTTIVRGVIDALVVDDAHVTVIEIKTGAPADWHRAQLDLYVDAARELFPGVRGARAAGQLRATVRPGWRATMRPRVMRRGRTRRP